LSNVEGEAVKVQLLGHILPGSNMLFWDGRNRAGIPAAPGVYFVRIDQGDGRTGVARLTIVK
jgi:hypothetical protein